MMLQSGLAAAGQLLVEDLRNMPGTVGVTNASASVPTTVDLQPYLNVGDVLVFAQQPASRYWVSVITSTTITLTRTYDGTTNATTTAQKDNFVVANKDISPVPASLGTGDVTNGSNSVVNVSTDLTASLPAGNGVRFATDTRIYIIRSITATTITLEENYTGATVTGVAIRRSNHTMSYGRFGAIALGTDATAAAATQTGLGAEITTSDGGRRSGNDILTTVLNPSAGVYRARFETTFTFTATASQAVNEQVVCNHATKHRGTALLRQVFASQLNLVLNDLYNVAITVDANSSISAPSGGGSGTVVNIGLQEACKLLMDTGTNRQASTTTIGSDWATVTGTMFDSIALGIGATAIAAGDLTLASESTTLGAARQTGDTGGTDSLGVIGSIMQDPPSFTTDLSTSFAGDTVQWRAMFSITGTIGLNEQGVFNGSNTANGDPAGGSRMLIRQKYGAQLNLVNGDIFQSVLRLRSQ